MGLGAKVRYGQLIESAKFQRSSQTAASPRCIVILTRAMAIFSDSTILFGRRLAENSLNEWFVQIDEHARAGEYLSEVTTAVARDVINESQEREAALLAAYEALSDLSHGDVRTIDSLQRCYAWVEKKVGNDAKFGVQDKRGSGRVVTCTGELPSIGCRFVAQSEHPSSAHALLKQFVSSDIEAARRRIRIGTWLAANETKTVRLYEPQRVKRRRTP